MTALLAVAAGLSSASPSPGLVYRPARSAVVATARDRGRSVAAASVYVSVNAGGGLLKIKPKSIHLVSNENLSDLRWSTWGGESATAAGTDHGNFPDAGHTASNPVLVQATGRRRCGSKLSYTTLRVHFTQGVPYAGQPRTTKYAYGCPVRP